MLEVGGDCALALPLDPADPGWIMTEGVKSYVVLRLTAEKDGATLADHVVAVPYAGQAVGPALP
jgi:hypothetical protein